MLIEEINCRSGARYIELHFASTIYEVYRMLTRQTIDDDDTEHVVSAGRKEDPAELTTGKIKVKLTGIVVFAERSNAQSV